MLRLESATASVNAAWHYLLENNKSFSSPVREITASALQKVKFKPFVPIEKKARLVTKENIKKGAKNLREKLRLFLLRMRELAITAYKTGF